MYYIVLTINLSKRYHNLLCTDPFLLHIHGFLYLVKPVSNHQRIWLRLQNTAFQCLWHKLGPKLSTRMTRQETWLRGPDSFKLHIVIPTLRDRQNNWYHAATEGVHNLLASAHRLLFADTIVCSCEFSTSALDEINNLASGLRIRMVEHRDAAGLGERLDVVMVLLASYGDDLVVCRSRELNGDRTHRRRAAPDEDDFVRLVAVGLSGRVSTNRGEAQLQDFVETASTGRETEGENNGLLEAERVWDGSHDGLSTSREVLEGPVACTPITKTTTVSEREITSETTG